MIPLYRQNEIELSAWRFLAQHRATPSACVTHVQFIDSADGSGKPCRMNTPSSLEFYESSAGASFGEAAIKLAISLGMPCPSSSDVDVSASAGDSSTALTATRPAGAKSRSSRRTRAALEASTTAATSAVPATGESAGLRDVTGFAKSQLIHHAKQHAAEWRRAGDVERAEAFLAIEGVIARVE